MSEPRRILSTERIDVAESIESLEKSLVSEAFRVGCLCGRFIDGIRLCLLDELTSDTMISISSMVVRAKSINLRRWGAAKIVRDSGSATANTPTT